MVLKRPCCWQAGTIAGAFRGRFGLRQLQPKTGLSLRGSNLAGIMRQGQVSDYWRQVTRIFYVGSRS